MNGSDKGFALCVSEVKLALKKKKKDLHSVFFQVSYFYHTLPLNLQALHKLSVIVAIVILILQVEVLRTSWLSFAKDL